MRTPVRLLVILLVAFGCVWAGSAPAQAAVAVSIEPKANLVADSAVSAVVKVKCDAGDQVLEAHLSLSQDDQTIFGQAGIPVRCDGKSREYRVAVSPLDGAFHAGDAFASAFVLVCTDPPVCNTTEQGQRTRTIRVR
jgi:hypothetical protein